MKGTTVFDHRNLAFKILLSTALVFLCLLLQNARPSKTQAYVNNPNVPSSVQQNMENNCPANDSGPNQTIGALYFSPSTLQSSDGTANTNVFATAMMCSNNNYNYVNGITINITGTTRRQGTGNIIYTSTVFYPPNIPPNDWHHATNPHQRRVDFTNLSQGGNCWDITYTITAQYGGGPVTSGTPGTYRLCVNYNLLTNSGDCDILSAPSTVNAGQTFNASFGVSNMGTTAWPTGGYPQTSSYAYRYTLRSASPNNTTRWGTTRLELPGTPTQFGPVFSPGAYWAPMTYSFTAPTTPGIYNFSWRISQENTPANDNIGGCTKSITVNSSTPTPATLSGVKIDNSEVSASGSSAPWPFYGGNCYSDLSGSSIACNSGTLSEYPFSDNCVRIDGGSCLSGSPGNPFSSTSITPGNHTISISTAGTPDGQWGLIGYKICLGGTGGTCTTSNVSQGLTQTPLSTGSSFTWNFVSGKTYYMRWIYGLSSAAPKCAPLVQTIGVGQTANLTGTGGSGSYSWASSGGTPTSGTGVNYSVTYTGASGSYTVAMTNGTTTVNCTVIVIRKPYARIYGGDSKVGLGFANSGGVCAPSSPLSKFIGFNNGASSDATINYSGTGSQLALFSSEQNQELPSAVMHGSTSTAPPPKALTFANSGSPEADSMYGGGIVSTNLPCIKNYFDARPSSIPITPGPYTQGTRLVAAGVQEARYVEGDVFITGNVTYIDAATGFADANAIPNFKIVARGNIYIHKDVSQLDGLYVAQPRADGTGGRIYTCGGTEYSGNNPQYVPSTSQLTGANSCRNINLTVNGALVARRIKLLRTYASMHNAKTADYPSAANLAAEQIRFTPELWIRSGVVDTSKYDAISALPPVL